MTIKRPPQALLFDLGGVLVDIDFSRVLKVWSAYSSLSVEELKTRFGFDLQYHRHERGEINATEYFDYLASILDLNASREQIVAGWNAIFIAEFAETSAVVQMMRAHLPCYALTNTNAVHMDTLSILFPNVVRSFDRIFASHEMGLRKPERAVFEQISQSIGIEAGSILFFDDLLENIEAASEAGLQVVHVRSPKDVRDSLQRLGYVL